MLVLGAAKNIGLEVAGLGDAAAATIISNLAISNASSRLISGSLSDKLSEAGNDDISGNKGNDILWGGIDNDTVRGNDGKDKVHGGPGGTSLNLLMAGIFSGNASWIRGAVGRVQCPGRPGTSIR